MKAVVVTMTQQLAKDYLSRNIGNRKVKSKALSFYKKQMLSGKWKENGEPIIIDVNGVVKDGQHRLMAVADTGFSYRVPVISGVGENVMDTIDTGSNRSASDVLHLEGFKYSVHLASIIRQVIFGKHSKNGAIETNVSNSDILNFAKENKYYLQEICKEASNIASLQVVKVLSPSDLGFLLYKNGNTENNKEFLKMITGTLRNPKTATDYVYKKLVISKSGENRLNKNDKFLYIDKAFAYFQKGNPQIKSMSIKNKLNK